MSALCETRLHHKQREIWLTNSSNSGRVYTLIVLPPSTSVAGSARESFLRWESQKIGGLREDPTLCAIEITIEHQEETGSSLETTIGPRKSKCFKGVQKKITSGKHLKYLDWYARCTKSHIKSNKNMSRSRGTRPSNSFIGAFTPTSYVQPSCCFIGSISTSSSRACGSISQIKLGDNTNRLEFLAIDN